MRSDEYMIRGLKTFKLFSRLPDEELACLAGVMEEKIFPAGTVILREGDPGDHMYLLLEGAVDVLKTTLFGDPYVTASLKDSYHCSFGRPGDQVRHGAGEDGLPHTGFKRGRVSALLQGISRDRSGAADGSVRDAGPEPESGKREPENRLSGVDRGDRGALSTF